MCCKEKRICQRDSRTVSFGIPAAPSIPQIEVTFDIDANGIVMLPQVQNSL